MSKRTKVKCNRMGTPNKRTDPMEPGVAAAGVVRSSAKKTSATILTQGGAGGWLLVIGCWLLVVGGWWLGAAGRGGRG
jgi:hypothetical protein